MRIFPELADKRIEYAWGGNVAFTRDQMPRAGRLDGVYYAGGDCGHGIAMATHLDGLAALGERKRVETEAGRLLHPNTYLEPFALRALGLVREDASLIERAAGRFEALGLDWHAARTRAFL